MSHANHTTQIQNSTLNNDIVFGSELPQSKGVFGHLYFHGNALHFQKGEKVQKLELPSPFLRNRMKCTFISPLYLMIENLPYFHVQKDKFP